MISTSSSKATTHKNEYIHTFAWKIDDLDCEMADAGFFLPSVKFDFHMGTNMHFKAHFSIAGETCEKRKIIVSFASIYNNYWKLSCAVKRKLGDNFAQMAVTKSKPRAECSLLASDKTCVFYNHEVCLIFTIMHVSYTSIVNPTPQMPEQKPNPQFKEFFETKQFSDVLLKVGDKKIPAHKCLLALSSPVFKAMFKNEMNANIPKEVEIEDVDSAVFEEMLYFIYTSKVPNLKTMAAQLLPVSVKYNLEMLKVLCATELAENITTENAAETLILANVHQCDDLKESSLNFIKCNQTNVCNTAGFAEILKSYPALVAELLLKVFKS